MKAKLKIRLRHGRWTVDTIYQESFATELPSHRGILAAYLFVEELNKRKDKVMAVTYLEGDIAEPSWSSGIDYWTASIHIVNPEEDYKDENAIECHGETKEEAERLRELILKALQAYNP